MGNADFSQLYINLTPTPYESLAAAQEAGAATLNYGKFIQTVIDFLLVAFAVFLVVKAINAARKKEEAKPAPPPAPSKQEVLLAEIRDLLKSHA